MYTILIKSKEIMCTFIIKSNLSKVYNFSDPPPTPPFPHAALMLTVCMCGYAIKKGCKCHWLNASPPVFSTVLTRDSNVNYTFLSASALLITFLFIFSYAGPADFAVSDCWLTFVDLVLLNTFQKRSVSSPAPVTMASPSGDMACDTITTIPPLL